MTPAVAEEVRIEFDPDEEIEPREIDVNDARTAEEIAAEFDAGMLSESDFEKPAQPLPDEVLVFAPDLPAESESPGPEVELLLDVEQAHRLLDSLAPASICC